MTKPILVVHGAHSPDDVPGLPGLDGAAEIRCVADDATLAGALAGASVLLGWNFRAGALETAWPAAKSLRWVHWAGAGVDAVLFPDLVTSDVTLTNARGVFDLAMAEYALGLVLSFAKGFPETHRLQRAGEWRHRLTERIAGQRALIVGAGSIGTQVGRLLRAVGMEVSAVARRERSDAAVFGHVHAGEQLDTLLPETDFVILVTPLTDETRGLFDARRIALMSPRCRFINLGRGALVDQDALTDALSAGRIAGAALDVFETEPLPAASPLWALENTIVSPHMSGDFDGFADVVAAGFLDNFDRYVAGETLHDVVDKRRGYVPTGPG